jgi:hypothetical protein
MINTKTFILILYLPSSCVFHKSVTSQELLPRDWGLKGRAQANRYLLLLQHSGSANKLPGDCSILFTLKYLRSECVT